MPHVPSSTSYKPTILHHPHITTALYLNHLYRFVITSTYAYDPHLFFARLHLSASLKTRAAFLFITHCTTITKPGVRGREAGGAHLVIGD